jgi:predicted DNA-binding transcriptional regulator AlpA
MDLLTIPDFSKFANVPIATVRHWIATDQAPPSARIGRRRMFLKADCEAWVQAKFAAAAKTSAVG